MFTDRSFIKRRKNFTILLSDLNKSFSGTRSAKVVHARNCSPSEMLF